MLNAVLVVRFNGRKPRAVTVVKLAYRLITARLEVFLKSRVNRHGSLRLAQKGSELRLFAGCIYFIMPANTYVRVITNIVCIRLSMIVVLSAGDNFFYAYKRLFKI